VPLLSVTSVFRVTESPSIADTESPNTPDEHTDYHRLMFLMVYKA